MLCYNNTSLQFRTQALIKREIDFRRSTKSLQVSKWQNKDSSFCFLRGYLQLWSVFVYKSLQRLTFTTVGAMKHIRAARFYQKRNCLQTKTCYFEKAVFYTSVRLNVWGSIFVFYMQHECVKWTLIAGRDSDGMLFATCVRNKGVLLCISEESSKPVNSTLSCRSIFAPVSLQPGVTEKIGRH